MIFKDLMSRILPPKAELGFFQEKEPASGMIKNSYTRLMQGVFTIMFPYTLSEVFKYLNNRNGIDLSDVGVVTLILFIHLLACVAPQMLKNTVVIQSMLNAIGKGEKSSKEQ